MSGAATMAAAIPGSGRVAALALAVSVGAHLAVLAWSDAPHPVAEVAGGGDGAVALDGTSFADMAEGVAAPVAPDAAPPAPPPAAAEARVPSAAAAIPPTPAGAPVASPEIAGAPRVDAAIADRAPEAVAQVATPTMTATSPPPVEAVRPVAPAQAVQALPEDDETTTPRLSARPGQRPAEIVARAAALREERALQEARRQEAEAETQRARDAEPRVARQGNAARSSRQGSAGGQASGTTARAGGQARPQAAGNAAASSYPGLVRQRIARQRQPRGVGRGRAVVSFTVAGGGGLAALGLAASSGNARLDRAALDIVRRAAPFPAPPPGAQRTFSIPVTGQ